MALDKITYQVRLKKTNGQYLTVKTAKYSAPLEDLMNQEQTKRSARGNLTTKRVGTFPDITVSTSIMNGTEMSELLKTLRQMPIKVDFFDPELGNYRTNVDMYCKPRSPQILSQDPLLYEPLQFTLTAYRSV